MSKTKSISFISMCVTFALVTSTPAIGAPTSINNGDFEIGANGATSISGWTSLNERIDLGVSTIAGCVSQDTSNYDSLREYLYESLDRFYDETSTIETIGPNRYRNFFDTNTSQVVVVAGYPLGYERYTDPVTSDETYRVFFELTNTSPRERLFEESWTPAQRQAVLALTRDPVAANDSLAMTWDTPISDNLKFNVGIRPNASVSDTYVETWQQFEPSFAWSSQFVELYSYTNATSSPEGRGYVVHGPAIYSEEFTAKPVDDLSVKFAASDRSDDYKVFGYLLNTATCAQTEVIDTTGRSSAWQTVSVAVPTAGTYRFVFVSGTYDKTWGTVAGAIMFVDDVVLSPNQERVAAAAAAAQSTTTQPATIHPAPVPSLARTGADLEWMIVAVLTAGIVGFAFLALGRRKRIR